MPSTHASTKSNENKLMIFERKILRKIFGPVRNYEGEYKIRSNRKLMTLFNNTNFIATLKIQRLKWAGTCMMSRGPAYTDNYYMET